MFRKLIIASTALVAFASASLAADLPGQKAPVVASEVALPVFNWAGPYVGADIGGGWTNDGSKYFSGPTGLPPNALVGTSNMNASGVLGGLFVGYNFQLSQSIVLGVESDIQATSISRKNPTAQDTGTGFQVNIPNKESLPWEGSLRARLGYAVGNALFYGTGGLAIAKIKTSYSTPPVAFTPGFDRFSRTKTGWTAGAGFEYAISSNWTARAEYRFARFGSFTDVLNRAVTIPGLVRVQHNVDENSVRFGITYKFGTPAPAIVAKY